MSQEKSYVRLDPHGVYRVGETRVMLDSVVAAFHEGHSPETIQQQYPALSLEEVYGSIAYYLGNASEVEAYLKRQANEWDSAGPRRKQSPARLWSDCERCGKRCDGATMSRPRFLADHDLNEHIIDAVQRREPTLEFVPSREVGMRDRSDAEVLAYAAQHGFIVVSHDVNTMTAAAYAMLDSGSPMNGLLMVQQSKPIGPVIDSLILIWSASEAEEWIGQVRFLPL